MKAVAVLDSRGERLSACTLEKAERLVRSGHAAWVTREPPAVQLGYEVDLPERLDPALAQRPGEGKRLLLHTCCAPCSTYSINRFRELGFELTGHWYNPNIHPEAEHNFRLDSMQAYAKLQALPVFWEEGYEAPQFLDAIRGHERHGERCAICYQVRLSRTAARAREEGFDAFSTTLLISPYQDQRLIREVGMAAAEREGVAFFFENLRRGWAERGRLARQYGLYQQRYCGCVYSAREAAEARERASAHLGEAG